MAGWSTYRATLPRPASLSTNRFARHLSATFCAPRPSTLVTRRFMAGPDATRPRYEHVSGC
jgi:hypothetical protein